MSSGLDRSHLPHACGVYIMRDASGLIIYIGKAIDLFKRVSQYFNPNTDNLKTAILAPLIRKIDYIPCASEREALILERRLIFRHQPFFNSMWKDDKSYPYVKITLAEDFPRIFLTRKKLDDGGAYFGPYPYARPIKSLLAYLWRQQFFPLRPCRWDFSTTRPLDKRKITSCLYYHTGECPAPCAGKISPRDYRGVAERAVLFFKGEYAKLKSRFEREMKSASSKLEYEKAAHLRDNILALDEMGERVRVQAVKEEDIAGPIASSESVTDLQKALNLTNPPFHVECFDISHFQGHQTVASMVCFKGGEPNKDHYRKFKIKDVAGIDDFASMAEVVRRRYARLKREGALPDLVVVDGGKGQLSSALGALKTVGVKLPICSLAKRIEEVFVPGRSESLIMERSRPALRLLQRLRDEAHRFAITYNRLLMKKRLLDERGGASESTAPAS